MYQKAKLFEAFVLTYNRADFMEKALLSLLEQTYKDFPITVLDNASTDDTAQRVKNIQKRYPDRKIYFKQSKTNTGPAGNFKWGQKLAKAKYALFFHDDDILHPKYVETCLKLAQKHPHVNVIGCDCISTSTPETTPWRHFSGKYYLCDRKVFAHYMLAHKGMAWPATIYNTKVLKKTPLLADKGYGKTADRVILMDAVANGFAVVFPDRYLKYRHHPGQDTFAYSTGPYEHEIIALLKKFKKEARSTSKAWKLAYNCFILEKMKSNWRWALKKQMTFEQFQKDCVKAGVIDKVISNTSYKLTHYFAKVYRMVLFNQFRRTI
ncbi:MAG: glycosyltransferase family 2 protein [Alphaproteobacteria bacterium]|nr:glycosyltransferase family 2 protein [Alphaproteobacteria bacterium]